MSDELMELPDGWENVVMLSATQGSRSISAGRAGLRFFAVLRMTAEGEA